MSGQNEYTAGPSDANGSDKKLLRLTYQLAEKEIVFESEADTVLIGRANECDVQIRHESVSRHHAKIV
ncbi:MAG: pSer/pThr/pTyr-binding forkhead associated (FHA) protein, partial [Myxococcota bacterium]